MKKRRVGKFNIGRINLKVNTKKLNWQKSTGIKYDENGERMKVALSTDERKEKRKLDNKINSIYDKNKKMLEEKGITKEVFENRIKNIMFEKPEGQKSLRDVLETVSNTRAFTTERESAIKELQKRARIDPEFRAELKVEFGSEKGRIQWSKIFYDKEQKGWVMQGRDAVIRSDRAKKKGDTPRGKGFKIGSKR